MRILLVYPTINLKLGVYGFQYGLGTISAYLKEHGYTDIRLCVIAPQYEEETFRGFLRDYRPDVVGFYTSWDQFRYIKKLVALVRDEGVFTILGGPHPTLFPGCMEEIPRLDAVCVGEGEGPMLEVVRALEQGRRPTDVAGLWVRDGAEIVKNPPGPFIPDIGAIPLPDRDLFEQSKIKGRFGLKPITHRNVFRITRGCPYGCTFCSAKALSCTQEGAYLRYQPIGRVIDEIKDCVRRYGISELIFLDDTFLMREDIAEEFVERYSREVNLPFDFFGRIPVRNEALLRKLKAAGGRRISFGVEHGNEAFRRDVIHKSFTNEDVVETFELARRVGLTTEAFVIVGFPDETEEIFEDTVRLMRRIQPDLYTLCIYFPVLGTELYDRAVEKGYIEFNQPIADDYVTYRNSLLDMPQFPDALIRRRNFLFGAQVFGRTNPKKALMFMAYDSPWGDRLLHLISGQRRLVNRIVFS